MNGNDTAHIRRLIGELQQATLAIGQAMYQSSGTSGGSTEPRQGGPEGEDVVEGEFRTM
jgi:hypothetical protein